MSTPLPLHGATISYRTPAGRRVLCGAVVAAPDAETCELKLRERIMDEQRFGRRRIGRFLGDFRTVVFATQIAIPTRPVAA